jgi:cysteine desulfurase family protein (TIGR01976 family)
VVVTELDHQANVAPWRQIAADRGATVHAVPFDPGTAALDLGALERVLSPRTRLVAVGAASNAVGTVTDVARVATLAREAGALCYVDAVHLAPHRLLDVAAIGCDVLVCSAYKFFGPHVGILWGRQSLLEEVRPYKVPPAADTAPERWETGTLNHEGIAGAAAAVEWIAGIGGDDGDLRMRLRRAWEWIGAHEAGLFERLRAGLTDIRGVRIFGPPPGAPRTPTAAFAVDGVAPDVVAARLADEEVYVWSGDFYAPTVVAGIGRAEAGGVVRAGLAAYSSAEEVERLVAGVRRIARA